VKTPQRKGQWWPIVGGVVVVLLAAAVITFGSFTVPLKPNQGNAFAIFALIAIAFLIFALILARS
jgi:uncharacterized membrane protein